MEQPEGNIKGSVGGCHESAVSTDSCFNILLPPSDRQADRQAVTVSSEGANHSDILNTIIITEMTCN